MKYTVLKNFSTVSQAFRKGQVIDLPKGSDWVKVGLVKVKRQRKKAVKT